MTIEKMLDREQMIQDNNNTLNNLKELRNTEYCKRKERMNVVLRFARWLDFLEAIPLEDIRNNLRGSIKKLLIEAQINLYYKNN